MRKRTKTVAVLLSACLCVTCVTPAFAAEDARAETADTAVETVITEDAEPAAEDTEEVAARADGQNEEEAAAPAAEAGAADESAAGEAEPEEKTGVEAETAEEAAETSDSNGEKESAAKNPPDEVTGIEPIDCDDELDVGEVIQYPTTGENDKIGRYSITWKSSDEAIARFNGGTLSVISSGKCTITGTVPYNGEEHPYAVYDCSVYDTAKDFAIEDMEIEAGSVKRLQIYPAPEFSRLSSITMESDNTKIASVLYSINNIRFGTGDEHDLTGAHLIGAPIIIDTYITGSRNGTANIRIAAVSNGKTIEKTFKVTVGTGVEEDIIIDMPKATIMKGDKIIAAPHVTTQAGSYTISDNWTDWQNSDPKVVSVTQNGLITALKGGTAVVTASNVERPWIKARHEITVRALAEKLTLNKASTKLFVGKSVTLVPTVMPEDTSNKSVRWTSSDTKVATVTQSGKVTAKRRGTAIITCITKDGSGKSAKCKITVALPINKITLSKTSATLAKGKKLTLKATAAPRNASDKTVRWTTSNAKVAVVSADGVITAKGKGKATITCRANDGSGVKASCTITVK